MVIDKENERIPLQEKKFNNENTSLIIPVEGSSSKIPTEKSPLTPTEGLSPPTRSGARISQSIPISTPTQDEGTVTGHDILREAARRDLENYMEKMVNQMSKGRKRVKHYEIGDLVRIAVPKIDRFGVDRPTLPCKVLKKMNNQYQLGSKFGIINVLYLSGELDPLGTEQFPELDVIPMNEITVREAAHLQNVEVTTGSICNCKGDCNSNRCCCKKLRKNCGSRCHSGRRCQNKCDD